MFERQLIKYIWAAPYTAIGLAFGAVTLLFGASVRLHGGVFEFGGGHVGRLASRLPVRLRFSAITFGHVVLGIDEAKLAAVRTHERVHVRQYAFVYPGVSFVKPRAVSAPSPSVSRQLF